VVLNSLVSLGKSKVHPITDRDEDPEWGIEAYIGFIL
jgi:hypothetical protein